MGQLGPYGERNGGRTLSFFAAGANSIALADLQHAIAAILCLRRHARRRREARTLRQRAPAFLRRLGRLLCLLGIHDFRILEVKFGFGVGNRIEKLECRRCGLASTRRLE